MEQSKLRSNQTSARNAIIAAAQMCTIDRGSIVQKTVLLFNCFRTMTLREKIGKAIIRLRKRLGYSQEQFAYDSNIDRRYMSDLENGKRNISIDVIERLAKTLGIKASTLLFEAENEGSTPNSIQSIKQWLCQRGYEDTVVLDNPSYQQAIIGISDQGRLIYSYDKMIDCLRLSNSMSADEAVEFIDFNTIRTLPNLGDKSPIIMYNI